MTRSEVRILDRPPEEKIFQEVNYVLTKINSRIIMVFFTSLNSKPIYRLFQKNQFALNG